MLFSESFKNINVNKLHESILNVFSDGIYITDSEGKTLAVNHMYEQLTGIKSEEIVGKPVEQLVNLGVFDVVVNPEVVKTGKEKTSLQITKSGRRVILNGRPVFDKKGTVVMVMTFVRDITLLSQLQEQLKYQQEIADRYREVQKLNEEFINDPFIYESEEMVKLVNLLDKVAKTDATVLLLGETGVGKGVLAKQVHERSLRKNEQFFKIDCSAIPETLIESELFGYESGAFSGASSKGKAGLFEMAHNGTLFLDEIGELPLQMQAKLLRAIQDQEIIRVGSTKVRKYNVRFIAATNRNLEEEVSNGNFRSDLYYRLKVACLDIPPLRARRADIASFIENFAEKYNTKYRKNVGFTPEVIETLENYKWPGNVRELDNFIQSLIVTKDSEISISDLPRYMLTNTSYLNQLDVYNDDKTLDDIVGDFEKDVLKKALEAHGSMSKVAKIFKVDRTTIYRKAKKYGLIK